MLNRFWIGINFIYRFICWELSSNCNCTWMNWVYRINLIQLPRNSPSKDRVRECVCVCVWISIAVIYRRISSARFSFHPHSLWSNRMLVFVSIHHTWVIKLEFECASNGCVIGRFNSMRFRVHFHFRMRHERMEYWKRTPRSANAVVHSGRSHFHVFALEIDLFGFVLFCAIKSRIDCRTAAAANGLALWGEHETAWKRTNWMVN